MDNIINDERLNLRQAADYLQLSLRTFQKIVASRKIAYISHSRKVKTFRKTDLIKYEQSKYIKPLQ